MLVSVFSSRDFRIKSMNLRQSPYLISFWITLFCDIQSFGTTNLR